MLKENLLGCLSVVLVELPTVTENTIKLQAVESINSRIFHFARDGERLASRMW